MCALTTWRSPPDIGQMDDPVERWSLARRSVPPRLCNSSSPPLDRFPALCRLFGPIFSRCWQWIGRSHESRTAGPSSRSSSANANCLLRWGRTFESIRARHSASTEASLACAAWGRILAATPRRFGCQPKISKTTPCKVANGRQCGPALDTSGKSTARLHHRINPSNARGPAMARF
jgi:hypothetical protein